MSFLFLGYSYFCGDYLCLCLWEMWVGGDVYGGFVWVYLDLGFFSVDWN